MPNIGHVISVGDVLATLCLPRVERLGKLSPMGDSFQDVSLRSLAPADCCGGHVRHHGHAGHPGKLTGAMPSELRAEYYSLLDHRGDLMKI